MPSAALASLKGPAPTDRGRCWADVAGSAVLLLLLALYARAELDLSGRPEEDAAMLLRYAGHLAHGHGIVWNLGEPPLDGATDFLFMVLVAAFHAAGASLEGAAKGLGLVAHALTVLVVFLAVRRLFRVGLLAALVPSVFLALGPGLRHLAACYGTPLFALFASVDAWLAWRCVDATAERLSRRAWAFALVGLALGLARPEGVFLAGFLLAAIVVARGGRGAQLLLSRFAIVFLTLGLCYFLWRWHYFGHPLPNPFYKKGAGALHLHSLRQAWKNLWQLGAPFLLPSVAGLFAKGTRRLAVFTLLPVLSFATLWILISDETNYVMRFRYPVLPLLLIGAVPVVQAWAAAMTSKRGMPPLVAWPLALAASAACAAWQHASFQRFGRPRMGLYDAGLLLREYSRRDYTLVTSEAGLLPFYSSWRAIDAWGLNDRYVARNGRITEDYLDRYRPELIVFHAYFSPEVDERDPRVARRSLGPAWNEMTLTLKGYAERNDYVLAAVFGRNAWDTHYYYLRKGFPESREIANRLRALDYPWDGEPTANFAPPE